MVARRQATLDAAWRRITGTTDLDGADLSADLVVESVAEHVAVKRRLHQAIEPRLGPSSILGTCTSSLSRLSTATAVPAMLTALTEEGALGVKSGRGLLGRYEEDEVREVTGVRARGLLMVNRMAAARSVVRSDKRA
jgi:3-hydroxyacyl-CoA dehydrogenase